METTTLFLTFLEPLKALREWLESLINVKAQQDENHRIALRQIYTAIAETRFYLQDRDAGKKRDRERERTLSRLWYEVAVDLRKIDRDLADRCLIKGDFWADPSRYPDEAVRRARITLDKVFKDARKLLGECR